MRSRINGPKFCSTQDRILITHKVTSCVCSHETGTNDTITIPPGKEGTVSTASRNCRNHVQRLQNKGTNAPLLFGSINLDPGVLRPTRLEWQSNSSGKHRTPCDLELYKCEVEAKTAAFQSWASGRTTKTHKNHRICRLEARTGTSPPLYFSSNSRAPP